MSTPADVAVAVDWLALCRRAAEAAGARLDDMDPALTAGRGKGGDTALAIDRAVEDAVFAELESLETGLTAVSEERGEIAIAGGGPAYVVIDPIDGSRNAKRGVPIYSLSIAVASGDTMGDVEFAYVHDFSHGEDWWARRGEGAFIDSERLPQLNGTGQLELLGLETIHPGHVAGSAEALAATGASRLRALGSIALSLCYVAAGRFDGMVSLAASRSVDSAAGQLIVRETGGVIAFPEAGNDPLDASLALGMRSRVVAARGPELLGRLIAIGG
jgi:myo-inositol-1(or 4)-monophosphatase